MRQPPPHNAAQAFEENIREATARYAPTMNGGRNRKGPSPLAFVDPTTLAGAALPRRRWLVDVMVPIGGVTMLGGDGGMGKSLLGQQLLTACAIGQLWLGQPVLTCKAIGIFCEDDCDELHRRQHDINAAYGVTFADLGAMTWHSRAGADSVLMAFAREDHGRGKPTPLLGQIKDAALEFGARLVLLDSLHDLFLGNENDRGAARSFIGALRGLAMAIDGVVLLTAHPSLSGLNTGTGSSGSTAWNNAVRSRLYLTRPKAADGDDNQPTDTRILHTRKSNYGPQGGQIELAWRDGVFVAKAKPTGIFASIENRKAETAFLEALRTLTAQGRATSHSPQARAFAPRVMVGMTEVGALSAKQLEAAMEALFAQRRIVASVIIGKKSNRHQSVGIGEVGGQLDLPEPEAPK